MTTTAPDAPPAVVPPTVEPATVPSSPVSPAERRRYRRLLPALPIAAGAIAGWLLYRQLESLSAADLVAELRGAEPASLWIALLFTALGYVALTGYDMLALAYIGRAIPYRRAAPVSLVAYGIGNALGFPLFTATPIRFRLYAGLGLGGGEIVRVIAFVMATFWLGLLGLGGTLFLTATHDLARLSGLRSTLLLALGILCAALFGLYFGVVATRKSIDVRGWRFALPNRTIAAGQVAVSALDWTLSAAVLWILLPANSTLSLDLFLGAFLIARTLGLVSHVPGGLGVFEVTMVGFLAPSVGAVSAAGALFLYRAIYYLLPLALAISLLAIAERKVVSGVLTRVSRLTEELHPFLGPVVPRAMAIATFLAGGTLLVSGSLPSLAGRLQLLGRFVPLGLLQSSHLVASIIGLALLALSRGLRRRLEVTWYLTVALLTLGVIAALLRGLDWEEASLLAGVLVLLLVSRRHFYRRDTVLWSPPSPAWLVAVGLVLAGSFWLGMFAFRSVTELEGPLGNSSLQGDASRFLRAQVAIVTGLVLFGLWRLLRGAPPPLPSLTPADEARVREIVERSPRATATLAYLGDKRFLFDDQREAFVMYGVSGDSWIAMGDPVGPESKWPELVWRFREECDLYDERPVFYQVRREQLAVYLDAGLAVLKLGEAAHVALPSFSLEGSARKDFRSRLRKAETEGLHFEIAPLSATASLLPELREISDEWLESKNTREKGFSMGSFSEQYLLHFPMALARLGDRIVAFANVLAGAEKEELTVDLIRYRDDTSLGVMDFLFIELMLWGREQGYQRFSLGMAPLSGLEGSALAPVWSHLGSWLFRYGEHFYNFQGLRDYKDKFDPVWETRYLAAPGGLATSQALIDVARLIAGGTRGLLIR